MKDTLFVMDIGNTNMKLGVYEGVQLSHFWRIQTDRNQTPDELSELLLHLFSESRFDFRTLNGVVISSVVPSLSPMLQVMCETFLGLSPLIIGAGVKTGLKIKYENAKELGADRVVNAVAAIHLYQPPVIVVGLGTATTFCVIDDKGNYLGGLILPGIQISTDAMFYRTSQLPRIELRQPLRLISGVTEESMQAGAIYGGAGQVDGIVQRIRNELPLPYQVVATGGLSELIAPHSSAIDHVHPRLLFDGLRLIWELNR